MDDDERRELGRATVALGEAHILLADGKLMDARLRAVRAFQDCKGADSKREEELAILLGEIETADRNYEQASEWMKYAGALSARQLTQPCGG